MKLIKVVVTVAVMVAMAVPALADSSVYGSARMSTFYNDYDQADMNSLKWDNQTNSRFGMKASSGDVAGHVEVGLRSGDVYTRLIYGTYNFGSGSLLVGQAYTPYTFFSDQVVNDDLGNIGYGATYDGRQPQIKATFGGVYVAAIKTKAVDTDASADLPKLAAGYKGKAGGLAYGAHVAMQMGDDIDSILGTFNGKMDMGSAALSFNVGVGQNAKEFGISGTQVSATANDDTMFVAGFAQVAMNLADNNTLRAGFGYAMEDNDAYAQTENRMTVYVQDQITFAPGFFIVPEVSYIDGMDDADGSDGEKSYHVGAKWQVNF